MDVDKSSRACEARNLRDIAPSLASRLFEGASEKEKERFKAAERRSEVFAAWNEVCAGTREGSHVTGLHYVSDSNELVVYLDASAWVQEMTMLREIIRARMAAKGVDIDGFVFRTSKRVPSQKKDFEKKKQKKPAKRRPLTLQEEEELDAALAGISDQRLREALKRAEKANLEWVRDKIAP